jgi:hypothetical protein
MAALLFCDHRPVPAAHARACPATERHMATRRPSKRSGPSANVATGRFCLMGGDQAAVARIYVLS